MNQVNLHCFQSFSMGLIRYSYSHISGHHEPINVKFGVWGFFIMFYWKFGHENVQMQKLKFDDVTLLLFCVHIFLDVTHRMTFAKSQHSFNIWPITYPPLLFCHKLAQTKHSNPFQELFRFLFSVSRNIWYTLPYKVLLPACSSPER